MNFLKKMLVVLSLLVPCYTFASDYVLENYQSDDEAEQSVNSSDPCTVVICMYGKAVGSSGGSECSGPEKTFYNIVKKKKGSFVPTKTADARKAFISTCSTASSDIISKIISKFGRVKL